MSSKSLRKPTSSELILLSKLISKSKFHIPEIWQQNLLVSNMEDDRIGSLSLYPNGKFNDDCEFGESAADIQFKDADGVEVIATLYLDKDGSLCELDLWKTNFEPLLILPEKHG